MTCEASFNAGAVPALWGLKETKAAQPTEGRTRALWRVEGGLIVRCGLCTCRCVSDCLSWP